MTDEDVRPTPLRHHLLFIGLIAGLVAGIGLFFGSAPMQCQIGERLVTTGHAQLCLRATPAGERGAP